MTVASFSVSWKIWLLNLVKWQALLRDASRIQVWVKEATVVYEYDVLRKPETIVDHIVSRNFKPGEILYTAFRNNIFKIKNGKYVQLSKNCLGMLFH